MFRSLRIAFVVCAAIMAVSTQAWADPVTYLGTGLAQNVTIRHDGTDMSVRTGEILIQFQGSQETAYCVDLDHWILGQWEADIAPVTSVNGGLRIAYLYDHFASSVTTSVQGAGLQIAIWELLDDFGGTLDLGAGRFRFTGSSTVSNQALAYLAALPGDLSGYTTPSFILATESGRCPRSQNLIVPEPASLVLCSLLLPVWLINRRR